MSQKTGTLCILIVAVIFGLTIKDCNANEKQAGKPTVSFEFAASNYYLRSAKKEKSFLKLQITAPIFETSSQRYPLNLAIVIDKSEDITESGLAGSINAVTECIESLGKNDIISILAYNEKIETVVPAKHITNTPQISERLNTIKLGEGSSLFAAISKAGFEARKFKTENTINRIIILSAGEITIGLKTPEAMEDLGASLLKEDITVTAIGIGDKFNGQCLTRLAKRSGGRFYYAKQPDKLSQIISKDIFYAMNVTARDVKISIAIPEKINHMKLLAKQVPVYNKRISIFIKELYANQPNTFIFEADVSPGQSPRIIDLAKAEMTCINIVTGNKEEYSRNLQAIYTNNEKMINNNLNKSIMETAGEMLALDNYKQVLTLREKRQIEEAVKKSKEANNTLLKYREKYKSDRLNRLYKILEGIPVGLKNDRQYNSEIKNQLYSLIYSPLSATHSND